MTAIPFKWQTVTDDSSHALTWQTFTQRAKVPGGWVLNYTYYDEEAVTSSMVFIPDPAWEWEIE